MVREDSITHNAMYWVLAISPLQEYMYFAKSFKRLE
jgi:hypothetical protein